MTKPDAIRKILALQARACDGVPPEEAAACARKAAELRDKYGVTGDELRAASSTQSRPRVSPPAQTGGAKAGRSRAPSGVPRPDDLWLRDVLLEQVTIARERLEKQIMRELSRSFRF